MKILLVGLSVLLVSTLVFLMNSCADNSTTSISLDDTNGYDIRTNHVLHPSAYISQMCYTKTYDDENNSYNPCFACHTKNLQPNYVYENSDLQERYDFPSPALKNPFINNFIDFSKRVHEISDEEIIKYVNKSNYFDTNNNIILEYKLNHLSKLWDSNGDGQWSGYIPDCYYNFDQNGFDIAPNGKTTGWTAFAYTPFLGTFWPTNGSTDDVLIRLYSAFRTMNKNSDFNATVYKVNLAIVESLIKRKDIKINPVNENFFSVDLDKDGKLGIANYIKYEWAPNDGKFMYYVGYAKELQESGSLHAAAGLYPEHTEFLHSVRYIKSDKKGETAIAPRMKELRYAKKLIWLTYANLQNKGQADIQEKDLNPDRLEIFRGTMESGLGNNLGWVYQGFIEDKKGDLRPQSYEETLNCMGCHSGIGVLTDSTFAFPRKLDNDFQNGWYHVTQKDLKDIHETQLVNGEWELEKYLKNNPYGDEFRENNEIYKKFYLANKEHNTTMMSRLRDDISLLLYPSHNRALQLNKGYKALVEIQQFYNGKAGHIKPMKNIFKAVKEGQSTYLKILQ